MANDFRDMANVNRLIHEPARLVIMTILYAVDSADFLYLLRETRLTKGNLSAHLSRLEEAGYIKIEKGFRGKVPRTTCHLTSTGRDAFQVYRERLRRAVDTMPE
jgi:DNA-binding MarR family transcriptional regulator